MSSARAPRPSEARILAAAGSFTGLWALTWLGTSVLAPGTALQGGFAVGSVMAGSGLTLLWWQARTLDRLHPPDDVA